ncbi:MAG: hypothetical protein H6772_04925 [Pseudomonadales bacterium]|nr:hypothetical protein [Pseudomonadales bacterium]
MEKPKIPEELIQRKIPIDVFDASVISQRGEIVDVTSLIPAREGEDRDLFQSQVQRVFDWVAETMNSPEYAKFEIEIGNMLAEVKGQHFIFDIEGVVMNDVQNQVDSSERVYHVVPWMQPLLKKLIENGNQVGFWTSATAESLEKMRKAMSSELAGLPAISIEDWGKVALAYKAQRLGQMTDEQVIGVMQSIYPTASWKTFQAGLEIFDEDMIDNFDDDPIFFLRGSKYPQLFIPPENGFFVDDNNMFIESAKRHGWPKHRAIKSSYFPQKGDVLKVAQYIKEGMEQQ